MLPQLSQAENQKHEADDKGRPEMRDAVAADGITREKVVEISRTSSSDAEEDPVCQGGGGAKTTKTGQS
ncbi:hypothetical protein TrVGV298_003221 [Trichoderma virens]|nr:hypothetical protein TrVGV298_003221 [Trichoderma virens]UKZ75514.1 hypothetical protein TrVFT333_003201 [Trichoderma virens FT-333]